MTRREVDHLAPQRIMHGHYSLAEPAPLHLRAQAGLMIAGKDAVICGATVLSLAQVNLPVRLVRDTRIWIQVPRQQHWPHRAEVRLVRTDRTGPIHHRFGLPVLDWPYCWLQLASESSVDELVEVADAMMCRHDPLTTKAALTAAVESRGRMSGLARARTALMLSRQGTDSIPETDLRLLLVRGGLPTPTVNFVITNAAGRVIYILDLAYEEYKVAIEYDGAYHVGDRTQMYRDTARRRALEDQGWRIISVTSADMINDPSGIVSSVRRALALAKS